MGRGPIPSRLGFTPGEMPLPGAIRYQPRFRGVVPVEGAGCPRVTQPFAARFPPRWGAARLACVRRAASVHPEPGSNSPFEEGGLPPSRTGSGPAPLRLSDPSGRNAQLTEAWFPGTSKRGFVRNILTGQYCPSLPSRASAGMPPRPPISGSQGSRRRRWAARQGDILPPPPPGNRVK